MNLHPNAPGVDEPPHIGTAQQRVANGSNGTPPSFDNWPHNASREACILGGIFYDNSVLSKLGDLEVDDFFDIKHRVVFGAMRALEHAGKPIDVVTVEAELQTQEKLAAIGGDDLFLRELQLKVMDAENVVIYAADVKRDAKNRRAIVALGAALERAKRWPHDASEMLSEITGELQRIEVDHGLSTSRVYGSPFRQWLGDTEPGNDPADIFDAHGLIVRSEPTIFLGDPKVGKTLIITDLALHLAAGRREWCGVPLYRRCKVLALLREDSERTTKRRIFQLARGAGIELWELEGWLEVDGITPLYFDDPKHMAQLTRQVKDFDIVLIDSLSTIHNGDENSVESMAPVMNQWRDISLTTKTGIPIIHHFRKRPDNGRGGAAEAIGGVLQRARGSSIIGATTRHAVGISAGPEKGQIVIEVESNHDVDVEPFVIARKSGVTKNAQRFLTHERIGSLRDARLISDANTIDPITLDCVRKAGLDGISSRELRTSVVEQMKLSHGAGCRPQRVDFSARRLEDQGVIEHLKLARKWRAVG